MAITRAKAEHPKPPIHPSNPSTHPHFFKRKRDKTLAFRHMGLPWKSEPEPGPYIKKSIVAGVLRKKRQHFQGTHLKVAISGV